MNFNSWVYYSEAFVKGFYELVGSQFIKNARGRIAGGQTGEGVVLFTWKESKELTFVCN